MASVNEAVTVFSAQSSDATSSAVALTPIKLGTPAIYDIVVSGTIGGGTLTISISHDSTDGSDGTFVPIPTYAQSQIGLINYIDVTQPVWIKGTLAGATTPSLTVKLYRKYYAG